jgi:farnesol dehydrogenase
MNGLTGLEPKDRILVTGGTGYLGKHLVHEFLREGYEVILLTRDGSDRCGLPLAGVRYRTGDLLDPASYEAVLREVGAVVHCAGLVSAWDPDPGRFDRINVEALDQLLRECRGASVARVVYTSSFFTLGPGPDAMPRIEAQRAPGAGFNDYDRTKILGARVVDDHRQAGLDVVSVLPTVLYGPGPRTQGNHVATILEDLLAQKLPGIIGDGSQVWNYAFVRDVARGHRLALERGDAGADYLLGGENLSMADFLGVAAELAGVEVPTRKVPFAVLMAVARLQVLRARILGTAPSLTPGIVRSYQHHWAFDDGRAQRELGYRGRSLREGLRETLDWLRGGGRSPFQDDWSVA